MTPAISAEYAFLNLHKYLTDYLLNPATVSGQKVTKGMESIGHVLGFCDCEILSIGETKKTYKGLLHPETARLISPTLDVLPTRVALICQRDTIPKTLEIISATQTGTYFRNLSSPVGNMYVHFFEMRNAAQDFELLHTPAKSSSSSAATDSGR